jgi:hypothetical protein
MTSNFYKDSYQKLYKYLRTAVASALILENIDKPELNYVLQEQINLLSFLANKAKEDKQHVTNIISQFNEFSKTKFVEKKGLKFANTDEITDKINYLPIFLANAFNFDIATNKFINAPDNEQPTVVINPGINGQNANGPKIQMDSNLTNQIMANVRLQQLISSGEFYIFKTKPKSVL